MIPLFYPHIPRKKILRELDKTLRTRWIGQGEKVDFFEAKMKEKSGLGNVLFVNSCTSALELAYHIIGIQPGDEVLTPVLTCTATNIPLVRRGARLTFVDISKKTLNMDYDDFKQKVSKKTKAVVVVALGGIDFDRRILLYCNKHKIPIVVDAAQALGMVWNSADFVCYSFQAIKHVTTADGGLLCCKSAIDHRRAKLLRWFGIDREKKARKNWQAWERREMTFDIKEAGYKFQPTDVGACFGLVGMEELCDVLKYRKKLCEIYEEKLLPNIKKVHGGSAWLFGILVSRRDELANYLTKNGVETNLVHLRNDIFTVFGGQRQNLPNMNALEKRYLYLPLNTKIKPRDVIKICNIINAFYYHVEDSDI